MLSWVGNGLATESRLAAAGPLDKCLSSRTLRRRIAVRISCSSSSSSASPFPTQRVTVNDDGSKASPGGEQMQRSESRGRSAKTTTRVASISSPVYLDDSQDSYRKKYQNGAAASRSPKIEVSAKGKWQKMSDSSLSGDEPLPLPMTWPGSEPVGKEKVDEMLKCDPEIQNCKEVIYQWTGDCKSCQGTGLVSFYRKDREVISKCINCLGIGSVHKITSRADIQDMDGSKGSSNGSVRGSP